MQQHISTLTWKILTIMMLDVSLLTEMVIGEGQDVEEGMLGTEDSQEFFAKDYQVRTKYNLYF